MAFVSLDSLLDSNKIIPFYKEREGSAQNFPPVSVELHWTSNCNYDCVHCSYGSRRETKGYLSKDVVKTLVNDLIEIGCQAVYLSGGGEPTLMSGWGMHVDKFIRNGVEVALITNGVAVKSGNIDIARNMNYIAVSIYSVHKDRYTEITGARFFHEQFGLPSTIKDKKSSVIIGARCVLNNVNYDEVFDIYKKAIDKGFDYVLFIPAVDYEGRGVVLEQEWIRKVVCIVREKYDLFDHSRTNVSSLLKRGISHYDRGNYLSEIINPLKGCKAIQMRSGAFVNYDGGVYLCQPDIGDMEFEIGNINKESIKEIWNSDQHHHVIGLLNDRWNSGLCRNCRSIAFNKEIYNYDGDACLDLPAVRDPFL